MNQEMRAYAAFEVKALDSGKRTFSGWATTPTVDRVNDSVNPLGVTFKNPIALLAGHRHDMPVGLARFQKPTKKGVQFDAEIPEIEEPGTLKDRVDTAWGELKYGLIRAVSIGFRPLKYAYRDDGGTDFQEIEVYEISVVAIPALPDAVITAVKSMNGGALSRDTVQRIKEFDFERRKSGPVQLITRAAFQPRDPGAPIKLVKPSDAVRL